MCRLHSMPVSIVYTKAPLRSQFTKTMTGAARIGARDAAHRICSAQVSGFRYQQRSANVGGFAFRNGECALRHVIALLGKICHIDFGWGRLPKTICFKCPSPFRFVSHLAMNSKAKMRTTPTAFGATRTKTDVKPSLSPACYERVQVLFSSLGFLVIW